MRRDHRRQVAFAAAGVLALLCSGHTLSHVPPAGLRIAFRPDGVGYVMQTTRGLVSWDGSRARFGCLEAFGVRSDETPKIAASSTGALIVSDSHGFWLGDPARCRAERPPTVRSDTAVVHCYTTPTDIQEDRNLAALGAFCRKMGREARQGEIGLVVGDEYFAVRELKEEWTMKTQLDMDKIAKGLGAERRGKVAAGAGYFGAMQVLADIETRFRVPSGGGRATDPAWTERRLLPLAPKTLKRLEEISAKVREHGMSVEPMQLAALLIEKTAEDLSEEEAEDLVRPKRRASR